MPRRLRWRLQNNRSLINVGSYDYTVPKRLVVFCCERIMAIRDIVLFPDDVLTQKCDPVDEVDDSIRQLVDDMVETMYDAPGVGLAAPQIGVPLRITVIDPTAGEEEDNLYVLINPEIVEVDGRITWEEGCLSIPGVYEKINRAAQVKVRALDRDGNPYELEAEELLSVCIQHEIDHLDGVLFLDRMSRLKRRIAVKKYKKHLAKLKKAQEKEEEGS